MWCYAGVLSATLPQLSRLQGMVLNFSGSALANIVPFGGADHDWAALELAAWVASAAATTC